MSVQLSCLDEQKIKDYLDQVAQEDETFAKNYKKENKNFKECLQFIYEQVYKAYQEGSIKPVNFGGGKGVAIEADSILGLAIHYYDEDDIVVGKKQAPATPTAETKTVKKEEPKKQKSRKKKEVKDVVVDTDDIPDELEIPLF